MAVFCYDARLQHSICGSSGKLFAISAISFMLSYGDQHPVSRYFSFRQVRFALFLWRQFVLKLSFAPVNLPPAKPGAAPPSDTALFLSPNKIAACPTRHQLQQEAKSRHLTPEYETDLERRSFKSTKSNFNLIYSYKSFISMWWIFTELCWCQKSSVHQLERRR